MSEQTEHGQPENANVFDIAEEKRRNALYVLRILLGAYVPKNTPDSREMEAAFKTLESPPK